MDLNNISIDADKLREIADFAETLTNIYHRFVHLIPDFDDRNYPILGVDGEALGIVAITENCEFEFYPGAETE